MPRYVILEHNWPTPHWDLLLEAGEVLRAFRLLAEPQCGTSVPAERNFDHRPVYLEYEGPLTGDRGFVSRWDAGTFEWLTDESGQAVIEVQGARLSGRMELAISID